MTKARQNIVALVPLRGGSKSIPLKNIKLIGGRPLFSWAISSALDSGIFSRVVVSTDHEMTAATVNEHFPSVEVLRRPAELATDTASTESVMLHAAASIDFDVLCTIQVTSPLVQPTDFQSAWNRFRQGDFDSLLTATRLKRFLWSNDGRPLNYDPIHRPRRQDFTGTLMENGAFYFTTRSILEREGSRLGGRIIVHEMHEDSAVEIDEPSDWRIVEDLLRRKRLGSLHEVARQLQYFFFDVDGTLTDGTMYYGPQGEALKRFFTRDGAGIARLRATGVKVCSAPRKSSHL